VRVRERRPLWRLLGEDLTRLDGAATDGFDLSIKTAISPTLTVEEVEFVHGSQPPNLTRARERPHGFLQWRSTHHAAAVDLPGRSRVFREKTQDHYR